MITAAEIAIQLPTSVSSTISLRAVEEIMQRYSLTTLPVVSDGMYVTLITVGDLHRFLMQADSLISEQPLSALISESKVGQVSVPNPPVVTPDAELPAIIDLLLQSHNGLVSVVDPETDELVGIITERVALNQMHIMMR